jgi:hypothetical protein
VLIVHLHSSPFICGVGRVRKNRDRMASLENVTGSLFLDEWGKIIMKKKHSRGNERERNR